MLYLNNITSDAQQQLTLTGIPGVLIGMTLRFYPRIQSWKMDIAYNGGLYNGISVVGGLNLLRPWKNILPFGISCICANGLDPYEVTAFETQAANLYLLNSDDVAQIEKDWFT